MTREDLEKLWPILEAYRQGKTIEIYNVPDKTWYEHDDPGFDGDPDFYRVAPEPKYRPFQNSEECLEEMIKHQPVGWIKSSTGILCNVLEIEQSGIVTKNSISGYATAINDFVFVDGSPFGIKEED